MAVEAKVRIVGENATGAAFASILGDANALSGKLKEAFGAAFVGISAAGVWEGIKGAIEYGDAISKAAAKSGIAAEAFSQLAYAAKHSDIDIQALSKGLKGMQVSLAEGKDIYAQIGLPIEKLRTLKPDVQFDAIANAIARIKDPADRTAAAVSIFGKAGADLLPLLEQGAKGIEALRKEAEALGLSLSPADMKRLEDADAAIKRLDASVGSLWQTMAVKAGPAVTAFLDGLRIAMGGATDLEKLQKKLNDLADRRQLLSGQVLLGNLSQQRANPQFLALDQQIDDVQRQMAALGKPSGNESAAAAVLGTPQAAKEKTKAVFEALNAQMRASMEKLRATIAGINLFGKELEEQKKAYDDAETLTQTHLEKETAAWDKFMDGLNLLRDAQRISDAQYWQRKDEQLADDLQKAMAASGQRIGLDKAEMNQYEEITKQAARNMQDAFAQFLFDPFKDGLKGMLRSFIDTIRQMLANQAALALIKKLGSYSSSDNGFLSVIGSFFGGAKASGGAVSPEGGYLVGENGPEWFKPDRPGSIVPNGSMAFAGAAPAVNVTYTVDARGATTDLAAALPGILKRHGESVKQDIIEGLRRRRYPV
jgi:hypothetical protein